MNLWKGLRLTDSVVKITLNFPRRHCLCLRREHQYPSEIFPNAEMRRNFSLEFSIQDVRRRMVEIQWKDRLALEQEWMELYVDMPQEIEILWINHARVSNRPSFPSKRNV